MPLVQYPCPVTRITHEPGHHFFGYYDKSPWDATGRHILALRVPFMDRPPTPDDSAVIGTLDCEDDFRWQALAESRVWCWQQGNMLQWLPSDPRSRILFNTRSGDSFATCVLDPATGERELWPWPVYSLAADGAAAVMLNFARLTRTRPGYGYVGLPDHSAGKCAPEDDGIWHLDLPTRDSRLIVSLAQLADIEPVDSVQRVQHWVNHLEWNPGGSRVSFLHRWPAPGGFHTRLFAVDPDGGNLTLLEGSGVVSHYDWRDDHHILAWTRHGGAAHFHLYNDLGDEARVVGADTLTRDGHNSFSPDRRWLLTDSYPDRSRHERLLMLYHLESDTRYDIGRFHSDPTITGAIRCDLHPRWNRDGSLVCIDSIHEGTRQMYVIDVSSLTG